MCDHLMLKYSKATHMTNIGVEFDRSIMLQTSVELSIEEYETE